eukprot:5563520-Prymnesium_polylepis.1
MVAAQRQMSPAQRVVAATGGGKRPPPACHDATRDASRCTSCSPGAPRIVPQQGDGWWGRVVGTEVGTGGAGRR